MRLLLRIPLYDHLSIGNRDIHVTEFLVKFPELPFDGYNVVCHLNGNSLWNGDWIISYSRHAADSL